jgi:CheY-like chemotaxis protein
MSILIVDDDTNLRSFISDLLTGKGYTVAQAANGEEALAYLKTANPLPCLILLDMMMPTMNGWEFLRARQRNPVFAPIPVVVISAFRALAESVAVLGVQEELAKPIDTKHLVDLVQRYCPGVPSPEPGRAADVKRAR